MQLGTLKEGMVRIYLLVLLLIGVLGLAPSSLAQERDLTGVYICEGMNPDGKAYQGIVEIAKNHDTFELRWRFAPAGTAVGFGIQSGDVLAVSYYGGIVGLVVYQIEDGPKLVGRWTAAGADGALFSETLTKTRIQLRDPRELRPGKSKDATPPGARGVRTEDQTGFGFRLIKSPEIKPGLVTY